MPNVNMVYIRCACMVSTWQNCCGLAAAVAALQLSHAGVGASAWYHADFPHVGHALRAGEGVAAGQKAHWDVADTIIDSMAGVYIGTCKRSGSDPNIWLLKLA